MRNLREKKHQHPSTHHLTSRPHHPPPREKKRELRTKKHQKHSPTTSRAAHTTYSRERDCANSTKKTTETAHTHLRSRPHHPPPRERKRDPRERNHRKPPTHHLTSRPHHHPPPRERLRDPRAKNNRQKKLLDRGIFLHLNQIPHLKKPLTPID